MKKLLYIGCPNLGENMFATPCMELLSKKYEITFLAPERYITVFKQYVFLKNVIAYNRDPRKTKNELTQQAINEILRLLTPTDDCYFVYHNDSDYNFYEK